MQPPMSVIRKHTERPEDGREFKYTVSTGIAGVTDSAKGMKGIIRTVDRAQYLARDQGRDRYRVVA